MTDKTEERPEGRVKQYDYQPSKAERKELVQSDATPEEVIRAAFRQVKLVKNPAA